MMQMHPDDPPMPMEPPPPPKPEKHPPPQPQLPLPPPRPSSSRSDSPLPVLMRAKPAPEKVSFANDAPGLKKSVTKKNKSSGGGIMGVLGIKSSSSKDSHTKDKHVAPHPPVHPPEVMKRTGSSNTTNGQPVVQQPNGNVHPAAQSGSLRGQPPAVTQTLLVPPPEQIRPAESGGSGSRRSRRENPYEDDIYYDDRYQDDRYDRDRDYDRRRGSEDEDAYRRRVSALPVNSRRLLTNFCRDVEVTTITGLGSTTTIGTGTGTTTTTIMSATASAGTGDIILKALPRGIMTGISHPRQGSTGSDLLRLSMRKGASRMEVEEDLMKASDINDGIASESENGKGIAINTMNAKTGIETGTVIVKETRIVVGANSESTNLMEAVNRRASYNPTLLSWRYPRIHGEVSR